MSRNAPSVAVTNGGLGVTKVCDTTRHDTGGPVGLLATNEGADHPAHQRSLIIAFVIRSLDRIVA